MEQLEHALIDQQALQLRRVIMALELDESGAAVPGRELHQAEPVAIGVKPERLGVDGDDARSGEASRRQVALVKLWRWGLAQARLRSLAARIMRASA
jgi:hypothetical protein